MFRRRSPQQQASKHFQAAQQLVRQDRYDQAVLALDRAIACTPTADLYEYRGVVLALIMRNEEALEDFARALERASTDQERASIAFHRSLLYGREQCYDQALLDLTRACRLCPDDPTYREALAQLRAERAQARQETESAVPPTPRP